MFLQLSVIPPSLLLILRDRWIEVRSDNFHIYSQQSTRQTNRFTNDLKVWCQVASFVIFGVSSCPKASVLNLVYLFDDVETLQTFVATNETAFFAPSPRATFLVFAFNHAWISSLRSLSRA